MTCDYFGRCGSCTVHTVSYEEQLNQKVYASKKLLSPFFQKQDFEVFQSPPQNFRFRAEFKIFHHSDRIDYAMVDQQKQFIVIKQCQIVEQLIASLMPTLLEALMDEDFLSQRLFAVEFMSNAQQLLVTLIYHKKLDALWRQAAEKLSQELGIFIIGRSRGEKIVITQDYLHHSYFLQDRALHTLWHEGAFFQPNNFVNKLMVQWVITASKDFGGDLCELYCGSGNFTIALATVFERILATEVSKKAIEAARKGSAKSMVNNITFLRMSSEEFGAALQKQRVFFRAKDVDLDSYKFTTIFIDPPRSGLDRQTLELVATFEHIIYISCNIDSLVRDLNYLTQTHFIEKVSFFDQFPWTKHIETGVILSRL